MKTRERLGLALRQLSSNILTATDGRDVLHNDPDGWEVDQPWLWWTGPAGSNGAGGGPWGNPIPGAGPGPGIAAFPSIPGVARSTSLIVDTLATLPWHVYRNETERLTTPDWLADPQALRLDGRVIGGSVDETRWSVVDYWGQWILSALWWGDGFAYIPNRGAGGAPVPPLWLFHPADVVVEKGRYWVAGEEMKAGEIIHLRGSHPIIDGRGSGVLTRFAGDLALNKALRDYAIGAFTAGVPNGYLKVLAPNMDQDQADELKNRWMAQHGGRRSIAVLNATTEFHPLTWSPVDLGASDFARISLAQIALMFGIPAYLLGAPTDTATYANVESRMIELYQLTLLPWIGRIEAVLDAQFARGTQVRIEIEGLLRADTKSRYDAYAIGLDKGFLTIDEVRELESRPPLVGAVGLGVL